MAKCGSDTDTRPKNIASLPMPKLSTVEEYKKFNNWFSEGSKYLEQMFANLQTNLKIAILEKENAELRLKTASKRTAGTQELEKANQDLKSRLEEMTGKWQECVNENGKLRNRIDILGRPTRLVGENNLALPSSYKGRDS